MQERVFTVQNEAGIHCRPSSVILNTIKNEFPDHRVEVRLENGKSVEVNSILSLLSMELTCGVRATLQVEGIDEERAIDRLAGLFEYQFDFPPRQ